MKHIIRVVALSLVAVGAIASLHTNAAAQTKHVSMVSAAPVPSCNPGEGCGL